MLYTPDSGGTAYPRLGQILERFADLLRLKAILREDAPDGFCSWKTVQRLFKGEPVSDEVLDSVMRALLSGLVPSAGLPADLANDNVTAVDRVRFLIVSQLLGYEHYSTEVASGHFPLKRKEFAVYPYLRLLALDLGLRYGAWTGLCVRRGQTVAGRPSWLRRRAFAEAFEDLRSRSGLTQEKVAAKCNVSMTTVKKWKTGTLPENRHIEALARVLHGDEPIAMVELHLRLSALAQGLLRDLAPEARNQWWVDDLLQAFEITAQLVRETISAFVVPERDVLEAAIFRTIDQGPAAPLGAALCITLAEHAAAAWRQELPFDFQALVGARAERIGYWAKQLMPVEHIRAAFRARPDLPKDLGDFAADAWVPSAIIGRFDEAPPPDAVVSVTRGPDWLTAVNRQAQAQQAISIGDYETAVGHLRRAIELSPRDPDAHAFLGGVLGQWMARDGRLDLVEEALSELHIAVQLAPTEKMPINEIGVVLSFAGRHEEAEAAYAKAAPLCQRWAQHHQNRGWNLLALKRLEEARAAYRRAIELEPDRVECLVRLTAIAAALGGEREANGYALRVRQLTHRNPLEHSQNWLSPWASWTRGDPPS